MKQKGQGIVEFAVIVPMLIALGISIIYVGIMFLDYTQYSNAARDAARDISLQKKFAESSSDDAYEISRNAAAQRKYLVTAINGGTDYEKVVARYQHPFTNIYDPVWKAQFYYLDSNKVLKTTDDPTKADTVEVSITLKIRSSEAGEGEISAAGSSWSVLPTELKPIVYKTILENY